jgi:hypothetical protein|tara:strand:+ start:123 stop:893 length:771 start_codon:yes stop_codon:yes gene_type:complete
MENREYNNNNNNSRKRRILPDFIQNLCPASKKRRLNRQEYKIIQSDKNQLNYLPDDMLKLILKFSHTGENIAENHKLFLKYKFCCNENIIYFKCRLIKFLRRYKPSEDDIEDFIVLISKKHEKYKINSRSYPQSLIITINIIRNYFHRWAMRMKLDDTCCCSRDCDFCILRRIKIGYLLHILDESYYLKEQLTSLKVQKVLFMNYKLSRAKHLRHNSRKLPSSFDIYVKQMEWVNLLFNDILFNSSSKVYINHWKA